MKIKNIIITALWSAFILSMPLCALAQEPGGGIDQLVNNFFGKVFGPFVSFIFYSVTVNGVSFPLIVAWLIIASIFLTVYMGFIQFTGVKHSIDLIRGVYSNPEDAGEVALLDAAAALVEVGEDAVEHAAEGLPAHAVLEEDDVDLDVAEHLPQVMPDGQREETGVRRADLVVQAVFGEVVLLRVARGGTDEPEVRGDPEALALLEVATAKRLEEALQAAAEEASTLHDVAALDQVEELGHLERARADGERPTAGRTGHRRVDEA